MSTTPSRRAEKPPPAPATVSDPGAAGIDVVVESERWAEAGLDPETLAQAGVRAALAVSSAAGPIAVVFADDALLRRLNAEFRGKDAPTNVLAFPAAGPAAGEEPEPLGDVILALETISGEAEAYGIPLAHRVLHMIVHGTLHLQGYDHQTEDDARKMETMERRALAQLGVADPYEGDRHG